MKAFIIVASVIISCTSCQAQKKTANTQDKTSKSEATAKDSVEFYEVNIEGRQKNYLEFLYGTWNITSMKRQAKMEEEKPSGAYLTLNKDLTFQGFAGCNRIGGIYEVKGAGIKFKNVLATKMTCTQLEQESEFLRLLQNTVSTYSIDKNKLLLRDGSSNIIFEADRKVN